MKLIIALLLLIPNLSWGEYLKCKGVKKEEYKYLYLYDGRIKTAITTPDKMDDKEIQDFYNNNTIKYAMFFENEYFDEISGSTYNQENTLDLLNNLNGFSGFMEEVVNLSMLFHEGKKNNFDRYLFFMPDMSWDKRARVELQWIVINRYTLQAYIFGLPPFAFKDGMDSKDLIKYEEDNPQPNYPKGGDSDAEIKWRADLNIWFKERDKAMFYKPNTYEEFINLSNDFFDNIFDSWWDYNCSIVDLPQKKL